MKNLFLLLTAIFFVFTFASSAQEEKDTTKSKSEDEKVNILPDPDWDWDFELENFKFIKPSNSEWDTKEKRPFVRLNYGTSVLADKNYEDAPFKDNINFDIVLGYYKMKEHKKSILTKTEASEFFIANISDEIIDPDNKFEGVNIDSWRFGFNDRKSYGYKFHDNFMLDFGHSDGMGWTYMHFDPKNWSDPLDTNTNYNFRTFNESIRFGEQFESSVSLTLFEKLSLNAGYERINVYPRHMFWYWTLGKIIEAGGQGMIDGFVKEIRKFSPEFTPIFHFLLKSGLSYGIYELRKKKMNWPINTAPPFTFENIKFGASFNF